MKILMLHGYAQNTDTFQRKMRRLEERLRTIFPNTDFTWPEGTLPLRMSDISGHEPAGFSTEPHSTLSPDLRAWFHLRYVQDPPHGLFESLDMIAGVLKRDGPFDGVVAFSQGTVLAAMVASLLQEGGVRHRAYEEALRSSRGPIMPYPAAFKNLEHPPLKWGILYAGRVGRTSYYDWLYECPRIDTPFCHFVGMWDPMVDHEERDAVVAKLSSNEKSATIVHTGGHFAPTDKANNERVVDFIELCCESGSTRRGVNVRSSDDGKENVHNASAGVYPRSSHKISIAEWKRGLTVFPQRSMI